LAVEIGARTRIVEVRGRPPVCDVVMDGGSHVVDVARVASGWSVIRAGRSYDVAIEARSPGEAVVHVGGRLVPVSVGAATRDGRAATRRDPVAGEAPAAGQTAIGPHRVLAPMPGRVVKVLVAVGDAVTARQGLVVVEAMKMENELRAARAGTVTEIRAVVGALVDARAVLVVIE
jgi:biotin carboxyl carrier protein